MEAAMKRLSFSFLLCCGLLLSSVDLVSKELPTSSEWKWQTAAVAALSALFLGALYYLRSGTATLESQTKNISQAALDFNEALHKHTAIKDHTVLFLVKEIKDKQTEQSTRSFAENMREYFQSLHKVSVEKFGEDQTVLEYLKKFKTGLDSFRPRYEEKSDIIFNPKLYINPDKVRLYESIQELLRYMGGYWGFVRDLDTLIGREIDLIKQEKAKNEEKIKRLEDQIRKMKEQQGR